MLIGLTMCVSVRLLLIFGVKSAGIEGIRVIKVLWHTAGQY